MLYYLFEYEMYNVVCYIYIGDFDDLVFIGNKTLYLNDWRDYNLLIFFNLVYDVILLEFIFLVIIELGFISCIFVFVVFRMK